MTTTTLPCPSHQQNQVEELGTLFRPAEYPGIADSSDKCCIETTMEGYSESDLPRGVCMATPKRSEMVRSTWSRHR